MLILLLTTFGLWAQTTVSPPAFPAFPTNTVINTNRQQALQRAMQRALENRTNVSVLDATNSPVKPAAGAEPSATTPVLRNQPRLQPAATPGGGAVSNAPTGTVTPVPASTAPLSAQAGLAGASPGTTNALGEETLPPGMIDFRQADLNQVLDIYSLLVNRTILRPATLPAPTIVLKTQTLLTKKEAVQALDAVLALNGITMVNVGEKFVKALPEAQSISAGARFDTNSAALLPELGQFVTHVAQLKYAKPTELMPVLQPFVKIPNAILPIDSSMILVLRDYAENVKRMLELVAQIDIAEPSLFVSEVIPIKYAKSSEIADAVNSLSTGGSGTTLGGGGGTSTRGSGLGGVGGSRSSRSGSMGGMRGSGIGGTGYQGQTGFGGMNPQAGATGAQNPAAAGSSFSQRLQNIIQRASTSGDIQVLGQTKIISDERTNSLLIYASKDDMKTIKEIVAKLDVVLAQVLIEAVILEVTLSDSHDLGFSYLQHPQAAGNWTGVGAINNKNILQLDNFSGINGVTNSSSRIPSGFSYLMSFGQDLDMTVTALQGNSRARILQRPRIQTSHNEPAHLFVGESRPYPTSSYYGGGAYGGYSSIQQLNIGVTLDVTPLINPDGLVVMDIQQEIDSFEGNVTIQNVGDVPVTANKSASAKVSVRDHDTIMLGGLIETDKNKNASGVPYLMNIPLLGYLFRSSHSDETRKEFIVLIRPTVLPTPEIAALTATAEKNKMPGVRASEREIRAEETQRLIQADKADKANSSRLPQDP
jgi:general secretion pathway protein D